MRYFLRVTMNRSGQDLEWRQNAKTRETSRTLNIFQYGSKLNKRSLEVIGNIAQYDRNKGVICHLLKYDMLKFNNFLTI